MLKLHFRYLDMLKEDISNNSTLKYLIIFIKLITIECDKIR